MKETISIETKRVINPSLYNIFRQSEHNWQVSFVWEQARPQDGFRSYEDAKKFAVKVTEEKCPPNFQGLLWVEF